MLKTSMTAFAVLALGATVAGHDPLAGGGAIYWAYVRAPQAAATDSHEHGHGHDEHDEAEEAKGPHGGRVLEEDEFALLIQSEDAIPLVDHRPVFAEFLFAGPDNRTVCEREAVEFFIPAVEVGMLSDDDGRTHVAFSFLVVPQLFGCKLSVRFVFDLEKKRAAPIAGDEDFVVADDFDLTHASELSNNKFFDIPLSKITQLKADEL